MKKLAYLLLFMVSIAVFAACNDDMTYADQVDRERSAISAYIAESGVNVISEDEFRSHNYTTDVSKNEFVLFESSGLYMQIVRKGTGKPIADGENARVLCRYTEHNLLTDSIQISNTISPYYYRWVETMSVTNHSGTFSGSFDSSSSLMYAFYSTTTIPSGWLAALPYLNFDRYKTANSDMLEKTWVTPVTNAIQSVDPCLYDISFERGR